MATKEQTSRRRATNSLTVGNIMNESKQAGVFMLGMLLGTKVNDIIRKNQGGVSGLLGLDGPSRNVLAPALTTAAGLVLSATSRSNRIMRSIGYGMAATGGALVVQGATGLKLLPEPTTSTSGLGYLMDELPEPSVAGALGSGSKYVEDAYGNLYDGTTGDQVAVAGLEGEAAMMDENGNLYDASGNQINGFTEGNGQSDAEGNNIPGIGSLDGDSVDNIPGIGAGVNDFDEDDYNSIAGVAGGLDKYELEM